MRPVLHGDLTHTARALLAVGEDMRRDLMLRIVKDARTAARFLTATGRVHPEYGTGTLMTSARRFPLADEPGLDDCDYARCLVMVLVNLLSMNDPDSSK